MISNLMKRCFIYHERLVITKLSVSSILDEIGTTTMKVKNKMRNNEDNEESSAKINLLFKIIASYDQEIFTP